MRNFWRRWISVVDSGDATTLLGDSNSGIRIGHNYSNITLTVAPENGTTGPVDPDVLTRLKRQADDRAAEDYRTRFLPSAQASLRAHSWDFTGRRMALQAIVSWLASDGEMLVVTGSPGTGKTALLGLVALLADQTHVESVPHRRMGLTIEEMPPPDAFDAVFSAAGEDDAAVRQRLAAAAESGDTGISLRTALSARESPLCVLIDGLDEAADSGAVARLLLGLLATGGLRLVIGTRPKAAAALTVPYETVDLDGKYADPAGMTEFVQRALLRAAATSPYPAAGDSVVSEVADAVVDAAGSSFLIARLLAIGLAQDTTTPDVADATWRRALSREPGAAIEADLRKRLGEDAQRALDMVKPLAFAFGSGLPAAEIWPALASRLSGRTYDDADIAWLRENAGSYVVRAADGTYRPYHQALTDHLHAGSDDTGVHRQFVEFMIDNLAPRAGGGREWSTADDYTRTHLATHLVAAGADAILDELLSDPEYLLVAEDSRLLHAIQALDHPNRHPHANRAADAYRRAAHHFRTTPATEHRAYLDMIARCHALPELIPESNGVAPWRMRWVEWEPRSPDWQLISFGRRVTALAAYRLDDEPHVAVGTEAGVFHLLRLDGEMPAKPVGAHKAPITAMATREFGGRPHLLTAAADGTLAVWDLAEGKDAEPAAAHRVTAGQEVFAADLVELDGEPAIVFVRWPNEVCRWWLPEDKTEVLARLESPASAATFSHDGADLAVVGDWNGVAVVDLRDGGHRWVPLPSYAGQHVSGVTVQAHQGRPIAVAVTFNHTLFAVDLLDGTVLSEQRAPESVLAVAAVDDGRPGLVVAGCDWSPHPMLLWDGLSGEVLDTFRMVDRGKVDAIAIARWPTGRAVAVSAWESTVRVWELPLGSSVR
ncbi:WD40 repeat domain-containing protein [Amycolatopsis sp. NPDC058278]|uniref:WD40 repeat domain-containing protein n=1 Tax=Amycolatopsis sp. NPDC058278 TaxID=3346417 RepID=UPI0036DCEE13